MRSGIARYLFDLRALKTGEILSSEFHLQVANCLALLAEKPPEGGTQNREKYDNERNFTNIIIFSRDTFADKADGRLSDKSLFRRKNDLRFYS